MLFLFTGLQLLNLFIPFVISKNMFLLEQFEVVLL